MSGGYPKSFAQAQERLATATRNSHENCRFTIESLHDQRAVRFVRLRAGLRRSFMYDVAA